MFVTEHDGLGHIQTQYCLVSIFPTGIRDVDCRN